jgi:hypothetical protein
MARPRIAICFFGITRSLPHTVASIERNVIDPARRHGDVRVFGHLFRVTRIENPRSGESGEVAPDDHRLIAWDHLATEEPGACLSGWGFERLASCGDRWGDGFASLRNLVHQLHSLHHVTGRALAWQPDAVLFCRPDLLYHDPFDRELVRLLRGSGPQVRLPYWQWYEGLNDRFALVRGPEAAAAYGRRGLRAHEFCAATGGPLHAERLLRFALASIDVRPVCLRASRVRAGGRAVEERFEFNVVTRLHERVALSGWPGGVRRVLHKGLRMAQSTADIGLYGLRGRLRACLPDARSRRG